MSVKVKGMIDEDDPRVAPIGHPAPPWMVNYADLMTELVCFFVILYALSSALSKDVQKAKQEVEQVMQEEKVGGEVKVTKDGMSITLQEQGQNIFFESGQANLADSMTQVLDKLAPTLKQLSDKHEILVEGHTDNVPATKFGSNWELSTARATNVVRYFVQQKGFKPQRISAIGYGEYRPIAPNDTSENRAKNRRVVFFVKNNPPPDVAAAKKKAAGKKDHPNEEVVEPEAKPEDAPAH
jgi:flagellar motor protein MotB